MTSATDRRLPLPSLLSFALVAFTIEFDNEAEHHLPHSTSRHGSSEGTLPKPWLVSMAMYLNCMQFLDETGMSARELVRRARAKTNFRGMYRWGYISLKAPADGGVKAPKAEWIVRPKAGGRTAQEIWKPLLGDVEDRWKARFSKGVIEQLREALAAIERQLELDLPDCMPILGYGLFSNGKKYGKRRADSENAKAVRLPVLLARVLLAFALEFESESELSLAMSANVVRVLDDLGVPVRDLSRLTGASTEAVAMSLSFLAKQGYAVVETDPAGMRTKLARLNAKGLKAQHAYLRRLGAIEKLWLTRFGEATIHELRKSLEPLVADGTAAGSPLFRGMKPYPEGWRAAVRRPERLPHYPMVLHRGGYPDGS
jgi:DNA-binding MarR family transcriptional regulator